jgi:hypothetical protein
MASTKITRTFGSGNQDKWTFSVWLKRTKLGTTQKFFNCKESGANYQYLSFNGSDGISYYNHYSSASHGELVTNRVFRDVAAWYHIVFVYDSGNATSGDRTKLYINGVRETAFSSESQPAQDQNGIINSANVHDIGSNESTQYFDGSMSHVNFCDGQAYAASDFGETDSTSGIWKIKTSPSVTYGTNGFFLKMEDSSNLDLDSSGNSHTFTTGGTLTATKDNPSNNFCTFNSLIGSTTGTNTYSNGATIFSNSSSSGWKQCGGTLAATKGKYYYEVDTSTFSSGSVLTQFGWGATEMTQITQNLNNPLGKLDTSGGALVNYAPCTAFYDTGAYMYSTTSSQDNQVNGSFAATTNTSVIMIAIDLDNGKFYVGKDGTWDSISSSNPSAGTGGKSFTPGGFLYSPYVASHNGGAIKANFGNGYFGSTAIGSPVSAGEGLWKYTPPTNYGAFCTKNINAA